MIYEIPRGLTRQEIWSTGMLSTWKYSQPEKRKLKKFKFTISKSNKIFLFSYINSKNQMLKAESAIAQTWQSKTKINARYKSSSRGVHINFQF